MIARTAAAPALAPGPGAGPPWSTHVHAPSLHLQSSSSMFQKLFSEHFNLLGAQQLIALRRSGLRREGLRTTERDPGYAGLMASRMGRAVNLTSLHMPSAAA